MSHKALDNKNRWRSKTVGFRVSPEEWDEIERLVKLSGMSKQDYIMHRLQNTEMVVQANPRVVKALRNEIVALTEELMQTENVYENYKELTEKANVLINFIRQIGEVQKSN